jgi:hypothetical protein
VRRLSASSRPVGARPAVLGAPVERDLLAVQPQQGAVGRGQPPVDLPDGDVGRAGPAADHDPLGDRAGRGRAGGHVVRHAGAGEGDRDVRVERHPGGQRRGVPAQHAGGRDQERAGRHQPEADRVSPHPADVRARGTAGRRERRTTYGVRTGRPILPRRPP